MSRFRKSWFAAAAVVACVMVLGPADAWAQSADLSISKSGPSLVQRGQNATYTITVSNDGPDAAATASFSDALPSGTTFVSISVPAGWTAITPAFGGTGTVTATRASLPSQSSGTFTLVLKVDAAATPGSTITNSVTATTATSDPDPSNNTASTSLTVGPVADLSITKTGPDTVQQGQNATYTIRASNAGPNAATGVSFSDAIPAGMTFVSVSVPPGWTAITPPLGGTGTLTGTTSNLASGTSGTFTVVTKVSPSAPIGSTITNSVTATTTSGDPDNSNNSASTTLTVTGAPTSMTANAGTTPQSATASTPFANNLAVTVKDASNNPISGYNVTFTAPGSGASGTFSNGATAITIATDASGIASAPFTANPTAGGPYAVTAAAGGLSTVTFTLTNTSGPATHFSVSAPATTAAGNAFNFVVTALDASNNVATGYAGTVHFTSSDGAAALPANTTLTNGVGTFSATLNTSGSRTITATDIVTSSVTGTSASIAVSGAATHFSVSVPATAVAGSSFNFTVTALDASNNIATGYAGTVHFTSSDGAAALPANTTLTNGLGTFSATLNTSGSRTITASDTVTPAIAGTSAAINVGLNPTSTTLTSSQNPSEFGQAVTFTATASSSGGMPTGTVTFKDGSVVLGIATLSAAGVATFTASALALGSHSITASYAGAASFGASTSPPLIQTVSTPTDSLKLRALQVLVAPMAAQVSGQAIAGAVEGAIGEGFNDGGSLVAPSGNGVRFNFAADADEQSANPASRARDLFGASGPLAAARNSPSASSSPARIDNAFGALADSGPAKTPPRPAQPREWLGWAEVRGAILDRWAGQNALPGTTVVYGNQVNLLAGLTRKLAPDFLVGVLGGYETFDYRSDALNGRLKGDGWTAGSYLGWKITPDIRFDAAVTYSGIGYDGTAGAAAGSFSGNRWLVTSGLTGLYRGLGVQIEPSARVYALWERENAYTDTLGTLQATRDFSTGRASGGIKLSYPLSWSTATVIAPYAGVYGDYYFNRDSAGVPAVAAAALPAGLAFDGWSARTIAGVTAKLANGAQLMAGAERSGVGSHFGLWTYRARASMPFGAE